MEIIYTDCTSPILMIMESRGLGDGGDRKTIPKKIIIDSINEYVIYASHIFYMQDQIITQQIDIVVIGDRKQELVSLMLDREWLPHDATKKHTHQKYLQLLGKLVGEPTIPESDKNTYLQGGPLKFTKVILTDSFWLHIHFFVHDNKIFDPFVSQACRGNVNICIIAASQGIDLTATKTYLHQSNIVKHLQNIKQGSMVRPQTVVEAQVMATAHEIAVAGFPAVLALKITPQKRIIEESSNLRLTVNQISRWIVDRHFEIRHKIKIKEQLGDEIQHFEEKHQKSYCSLI